MLRACRRVLKPGAPLVFFVVAAADGLSPRDLQGAIAAGPPHVEAGRGYPVLLEEARFARVEIVDVTNEYAVTLRNSIRARELEATELVDLVGADVYAEGQASRRQEWEAIDNRLLKRYLISALRP